MNKTILILGASSDVGQSLISQIYDDYDIIIAHYNHTREPLELLSEKLGNKLQLVQADFSSEQDIDRLINEIKSQYLPTHIVHLAAPKCKNVKFGKLNWMDFQFDINTQLMSITKILLAFLPNMAKEKYGKIVFMLSSYTVETTPKYLSHYVTTKYAMLGLMKALSSEYTSKNLCINGVSPSMMETKFLSDIPELIIQQNAANNPRNRNVMVGDVVPTIEFLLSEKANFISGQNIVIAGR